MSTQHTRVRHDGRLPSHPYLDWAVENDLKFLRPGLWIPLLVELAGDLNLGQFQRLFEAAPFTKDKAVIPTPFRREILPYHFKFCVVLVRSDFVGELRHLDLWKYAVLRAEMGPPVNIPSLEGKMP